MYWCYLFRCVSYWNLNAVPLFPDIFNRNTTRVHHYHADIHTLATLIPTRRYNDNVTLTKDKSVFWSFHQFRIYFGIQNHNLYDYCLIFHVQVARAIYDASMPLKISLLFIMLFNALKRADLHYTLSDSSLLDLQKCSAWLIIHPHNFKSFPGTFVTLSPRSIQSANGSLASPTEHYLQQHNLKEKSPPLRLKIHLKVMDILWYQNFVRFHWNTSFGKFLKQFWAGYKGEGTKRQTRNGPGYVLNLWTFAKRNISYFKHFSKYEWQLPQRVVWQ